MDDSQLSALKIARTGHNCLITGMPGTGKTFLLGKIIDCMLVDDKKIMLTASTGKAALVLHNKLNVPMRCSTLHSCFGLMDGRFSKEELITLYNGDEYDKQRSSIKSIDVLVIDEVSMISARTLDKVEVVLRHVKVSLQPFGGVQVILTGDFFQLPPVPSPEYDDEGKYVHTHHLVKTCFHHINLTSIHRQEEPDLVNAIQEISQGHLSQDSLNLLQQMGRSLPPSAPNQDETLHLYATNFEVDLHNARSLQGMEGDETIYQCIDHGDVQRIKGLKELHIKKGCPVILTVNLTDQLVNGLTGKVTVAKKNSVEVFFPDIGRHEEIHPYHFTNYNPALKQDVGSRKQIPLTLAFALTVHKSQGLTLDRVSIDCRNLYQYGHFTVAISRVSRKKGLQIKHFKETIIRKPPKVLTDFYETPTINLLADLSCCTKKDRNSITQDDDEDDNSSYQLAHCSEEDIGSSDDDQLIQQLDIVDKCDDDPQYDNPFPVDIDIKTQILCGLEQDPDTPNIEKENLNVHFLSSNIEKLKHFLDYLWNEMSVAKQRHITHQPGKDLCNKDSNEFYRAVFTQILSSNEYITRVKLLFGQDLPTTFNTAFQVAQRVRQTMINIESQPIKDRCKSTAEKHKGFHFEESVHGQEKIRYIGGWCVANIRKRRKSAIIQNMYNKSKTSQVQLMIQEKDLTDFMEQKGESESVDTMSYITDKQNNRKGLFVISDDCLNFFLELDKKIRELQID